MTFSPSTSISKASNSILFPPSDTSKLPQVRHSSRKVFTTASTFNHLRVKNSATNKKSFFFLTPWEVHLSIFNLRQRQCFPLLSQILHVMTLWITMATNRGTKKPHTDPTSSTTRGYTTSFSMRRETLCYSRESRATSSWELIFTFCHFSHLNFIFVILII